MIDSVDFDKWREWYDTASYEDQVKYHSMLWQNWQEVHQHSDDIPVHDFFDSLSDEEMDVLEIGGWTGDTARDVLAKHNNIRTWINEEICQEAAKASVCKDERYLALTPPKWSWELLHPFANVLFMQHCVEHMRFAQFDKLIANAVPNVRWVFLQSPLDTGPRDWTGYLGGHIMEVGWRDITEMMRLYGFQLVKWNWDGAKGENSRSFVYAR